MSRNFCCDDETGEVTTYLVNRETGEPASSEAPLRAPQSSPKTKTIPFPRGYMSETKKFQTLKANILHGSNVFSPRLLVIPMAAICPSIVIVLIMIIEVFLHVCCHKENKLLKNSSSYYRSPFHIITSIFCGMCRECETTSKIGQMQDQRRIRYDYIKGEKQVKRPLADCGLSGNIVSVAIKGSGPLGKWPFIILGLIRNVALSDQIHLLTTLKLMENQPCC